MLNIRYSWWTFGLAACIVGLPRQHAVAQKITKDAPRVAASTGPTTLAGVYTNEQAGRGKDVYAGSCKSCHTPSSHTGAMFAQWWRGKRLSDLYGFVSTRMPKNDPGSLAPEDAADVVAYLLKMNAMPVGTSELYPDVDSLRQYRIETKRASATTTAKRKKP
jgi:mono/diheme cytochrome c family protein